VAATDGNSGQALNPAKETAGLFLKLVEQKNPCAEDVARLHQQIVSTPNTWPLAAMMPAIKRRLIEKMAGHGAMRALMLAEVDILAKQLGCDTAPPLERLLIEHLLIARLRLIYAETCYNQNVVGNSIPLNQAEYWDNILSSTQARFLRAIETLARVRRLARNTPALQINIARDGGKQVNVQGDAHARNGHPAGNT